MGAFLDALGIAHEDGVITSDDVPPPDGDQLEAAVAAVKSSYDPTDVDLYLKTLAALDEGTWANLEKVLGG